MGDSKCYGLNCMSSKNSYVEVITPEPQNMTLFGNSIVAEIISSNEVTLE